jgi:excisionase family DNA binding protein
VVAKREFLTTNEVAQILGISPFTVRRYIQMRKLKAVKLEGSYRVRQTHLEEFIRARELETEEEFAARTAEEIAPRKTVKPSEKKRQPRASKKSRALVRRKEK